MMKGTKKNKKSQINSGTLGAGPEYHRDPSQPGPPYHMFHVPIYPPLSDQPPRQWVPALRDAASQNASHPVAQSPWIPTT